MRINKQDTNGTKPLLGKGELGYDDYTAGGDAGRVYVGNGAENIPQAKKAEVVAVDGKVDTHIARVDNPHNVTKADVGLNSVDNTADSVKVVASAGKWTTSRLINGTAVDGTINVTTSQWGASRNITIGNTVKSVNGSANIDWSLNEIGAVGTSSPAFTGVPTAPTAASTVSSTQLATTEFAVPRTSTTGSARLPAGSTAQRDASPDDGMIRYNSTTVGFEGYFKGGWQPVMQRGLEKDINYKATPITIISWSYSGTTITLNVASHTFVAGDYIKTKGLTSTAYPANGVYLVTSVTSTTIVFTHFTTPTGTTGVSTATVKGFTTVNGLILGNNDITKVQSGNDYIYLPDGRIMQFGTTPVTISAINTITTVATTFPISFPKASLRVLSTLMSTGTTYANVSSESASATGYNIAMSSGQTGVYNIGYIAIGY